LIALHRWSIVGQDECAATRSARLGRPVPARTLGIAGGYACCVSKSQNALRKVRGSLTTEGAELGSKILRVFREVGLSPQRPQDLRGAYSTAVQLALFEVDRVPALRLPAQAALRSRSTSASVRYSRGRNSALGLRRGVATVAKTVLGAAGCNCAFATERRPLLLATVP
jgi:hypothetical protein